jgi:hypothetical protein
VKLNKQKIKILEINESGIIMITNFDVVNICEEIDKIQDTQNQFLYWFSNLSLENKVRYYFSFDRNYQEKIDIFLLEQLDLQEQCGSQEFVESDLVPLLNQLERSPSVFPISISLLVKEYLYCESNEEIKNCLIDIIQKKERSRSHKRSSSYDIILLMLNKNCGSLITKFIS